MPTPQQGYKPTIPATKTAPLKLGETECDEHEERLMDEAIDESFPASDPPAIVNPHSSIAVKKVAEEGRDVPAAEPDPAKESLQPKKP